MAHEPFGTRDGTIVIPAETPRDGLLEHTMIDASIERAVGIFRQLDEPLTRVVRSRGPRIQPSPEIEVAPHWMHKAHLAES